MTNQEFYDAAVLAILSVDGIEKYNLSDIDDYAAELMEMRAARFPFIPDNNAEKAPQEQPNFNAPLTYEPWIIYVEPHTAQSIRAIINDDDAPNWIKEVLQNEKVSFENKKIAIQAFLKLHKGDYPEACYKPEWELYKAFVWERVDPGFGFWTDINHELIYTNNDHHPTMRSQRH